MNVNLAHDVYLVGPLRLTMCQDKSERAEGLRVPFGESVADGRMHQPLDVPLGKACGCVCPGCRKPLIAKHCVGGKTVPHFAHQAGADCPTGYITALHKAAIQLILDRMRVYVPDYLALYHGHDRYGRAHTVAKRVVWAQELPLTSARVEVPFVDESLPACKVVPDVLAESFIGLLNIEVAVTHFVDAEKQEKLQRLGLATVELDLADLDRVDFGVLEDLLLKPNDRIRWVYNPGDARFYEEAQQDLAIVIAEADKKAAEEQSEWDAELAERQAERDTELAGRDEKLRAFKLEQAKRDAETRKARREELGRAARFRAAPEPDKLAKMLRFVGLEALPAFLPIKCRGGDSFGVRNPAIWQFALVTGIIGASLKKGHSAINVDYAATWLKYRFDIRPSFSNAEKVAAWDFLQGLTAFKILRRSNKGYFEILVADTLALLNLVEYQHKLQQNADLQWAGVDAWLEWVPEERWPEKTVAERVAGQGVESIGYGIATGWRKMMSGLLPTARTVSIARVVSQYVTETVLPEALGYLVAAGFLQLKSANAAPSAIRPPSQTDQPQAGREGP